MEIPSRSTASKIQIGASQIQLYYYGPWVFDSEGGCLTCNTNCESGGYGSGIWPAGPIVTPAWCVLQIKSMLSCVDSIKLSSVKQSRSRKGGSKEPSRTLTMSLTAMHALCPARARQSGSRPLARPVATRDYSETPAPSGCISPPLYRPGPIRRHARIIRSRYRDPLRNTPGSSDPEIAREWVISRTSRDRTSNLDCKFLSWPTPTPAPAPALRPPTYGVCAH